MGRIFFFYSRPFFARPKKDGQVGKAEVQATHMSDILRTQMVQAVRMKDDDALLRLYTQVQKFKDMYPEKYAQLPERLRFHSHKESPGHILKMEWESHVDACRAEGKDAGPVLWQLWSPHLPTTTSSRPSLPAGGEGAGAAEWEALQRKYTKKKKQVAHFENWYTEFENANRTIVEQLNGVYRRLHAQLQKDEPPVDTAHWLPLDDVAEELVRLVPDTSSSHAHEGGEAAFT